MGGGCGGRKISKSGFSDRKIIIDMKTIFI